MSTIPKSAKLNRPDPGQTEIEVTLTSTISKGTEIIEQAFTLKVQPWTHDEVVSNAYNQLVDTSLIGANASISNVMSDLSLPTTAANGVTISWTSSTPAYLDNTGKVTRPSYSQGNVNVTIEATITSGTVTSKKQFNVIVVKLDQTTTEYLDSTWNTMQSTLLNGNVDTSHITGNIYIPAISGVTITMSSNVTATISNSGAVTQPISTSPNVPVTLTFTLSKDGTTVTKTLNVIVLHA